MTNEDRIWLLALIEVEIEHADDIGNEPPTTADAMTGVLQDELQKLERGLLLHKELDEAGHFDGIPVAKREAHRERMRTDIERIRRLLGDDALRLLLLDIEDRIIYGESVSEMRKRFRTEQN